MKKQTVSHAKSVFGSLFLVSVGLTSTLATETVAPEIPEQVLQHVESLLQTTPLIDGHNDLPWLIREESGGDVAAFRLNDANDFDTDIPRMRKGHLGAQFWSVWIPGETDPGDAAKIQLEQITTLSKESSANKRIEQLNRELHQRCENLQEEIATQKKRLKGLQKDLAQEREEIKTLKQFDPAKMKKNLDAGKKKLAERTAANDLLQKSLNKSKTEQAELQNQVKELEAKLAQLETPEEAEQVEEAAA